MDIIDIVAAVSVIIGILLVRKISDILPLLPGCLLRWKECLTIENSVRLARERNIFAAFLALPFCALVSRYRLYCPELSAGMDGPAYFAFICAVTATYWLLRTVMRKTVRKTGSGEKLFRAGMKTFRSFCCLTVPTILAAAGICSFSDISDDVTRPLILYIMLGFYILAIFRELQIFSNCCSFLSSILYLCALEILPTGILLLPAVLL